MVIMLPLVLTLNKETGDHFRQKDYVIHAGEENIDTISSYKSKTITGEHSNLLILPLYLGAKECKELYIWSDKHKVRTRCAQHPGFETVMC